MGLSDSSINSSVRSVRVFVKWLAERELLKHPVTLKALRTVKKTCTVLKRRTDSDDAGILQGHTRQEIPFIIQNDLDTLADCDERRRTAEFKWLEVQEKKIKITSTEDWEVKNRKDAWVPISPKLQEEMSPW